MPKSLKEKMNDATEKHYHDAIYFFSKALEMDDK